MPTGILEVTGTIDIDQFWPVGMSDADTSKIKVDVGKNAFRFRLAPNKPYKVTHIFEKVVVLGEIRKSPIDEKGRITVRLQGVDAPELHYRPKALLAKEEQSEKQRELYLKWNLDFRQYYGENATVALCELLSKARRNPIQCKVITLVDSPNEVFDAYGRFIGDIEVKIKGKTINLNQWLLSKGWAFPAFYNSMNEEEISLMTAMSKKGMKIKDCIWSGLIPDLSKFNWNLTFRRIGAKIDKKADRGPLIFPKLFRRQSVYEVNKRSKMFDGTFTKYLQKHPDGVHLASEFLLQGPTAAKVYHLDDFVVNNKFTKKPADLIYREKPSKLSKVGGGKIAW